MRVSAQVAVVVDTFADARLNDVHTLAEEMEDEIEFDRHLPAKAEYPGWLVRSLVSSTLKGIHSKEQGFCTMVI